MIPLGLYHHIQTTFIFGVSRLLVVPNAVTISVMTSVSNLNTCLIGRLHFLTRGVLGVS